MAIYGIVDEGVCKNVIIADEELEGFGTMVLIDPDEDGNGHAAPGSPGIGWLWDGENWSAPEPKETE